MSEADLTRERLALNEARVRSLNRARAEWMDGASSAAFWCECSDRTCAAVIRLSREEWEYVRRDPRLFVTVPRHVDIRLGEIVERHDDFWIVRKHGEPQESVVVDADDED